jgi:hypothetical protein
MPRSECEPCPATRCAGVDHVVEQRQVSEDDDAVETVIGKGDEVAEQLLVGRATFSLNQKAKSCGVATLHGETVRRAPATSMAASGV